MTDPDKNARPAANGAGAKQAGPADARVPSWGDVYEDAERWVTWTARRRWPDFAANDTIWAASVADWELHGKRVAA